ncbi:10274_t:CDS:2 [Funneliformis geosporum]|uniref:10274_t:CDS:1 n=1 Tax=Funneliformis geosporum TaxID=1117311 RepID=A0A9W4WH16_9GLOM|nr:10274_t:CDS:2 [Funneliformis geosporum]
MIDLQSMSCCSRKRNQADKEKPASINFNNTDPLNSLCYEAYSSNYAAERKKVLLGEFYFVFQPFNIWAQGGTRRPLISGIRYVSKNIPVRHMGHLTILNDL